MGPSLAQRVNSRLDDIFRRIEIRLADFQMHNVFSLALELAGAVEHFESGLSAQTRHALGKAKFELSGWFHGKGSRSYPPASGPLLGQITVCHFPRIVVGCRSQGRVIFNPSGLRSES